MQVTETLSDGLIRNYTVVLAAADLESRRTERLTALGKTLRLPGFRPGKVPLPVVKQRYGTAVSAEVVEESVNEATQKVLTERGLRPAQRPTVDLVTENPTALASDIEFTLAMELLPEIALPDFGAIELTRFKAEVAPEQVDKALVQLAKFNHTLEPVPLEAIEARGYGAAKGEILTLAYEGKIDGVPFDGGKSDDASVEIGGTDFIPGFAEQLEGARPGDTRTIEVTFPDPYSNSDLAGKVATFDITIKQLSTEVIPPIDDDLAKKLGVDDIAAIREIITGRQQGEYDSVSRMRLKKSLLDALTVLATFPVPVSIADQEFNQIWEQFEAARKAGKQDEADKAKDDETLRAEYRAIAERRVRLGLLLAEIGRVNNITVTQSELDRALFQRARQYPGQEAQMLEFFKKYPQMTDGVRGPLLEDKIVDFVLELVKVTDTVVTPEELTRETELEAQAPQSDPVPQSDPAPQSDPVPQSDPTPQFDQSEPSDQAVPAYQAEPSDNQTP